MADQSVCVIGAGIVGVCSALYLQRDEYKSAIPILQQLVAIAPNKKTYWMQLSSVYGQIKDYPGSLAIMQLAYNGGLVTEDAEIRRLADLLLVNEIPYRCAQLLDKSIKEKAVKLDDKLYEKLANCWIAAGEFDKSIAPLQRAAELSGSGNFFVRLGEVHVQRKDWDKAIAALQQGISKGQLPDTGNAQMMMGVAQFNNKNYGEAATWFERAQRSEKYRQMATGYLEAIKAQS